jgi:hypothetical protein
MVGGVRPWMRLVAGALLLVAVVALHRDRKRFIQRFFVRGPGGAAPPSLPLPADPARAAHGVAPVDRVRVVLLDGLGQADARRLPGLSALCRDGLDLEIDVGFPTVSLPVQAALWTGLTQQQSGIQFVGKRIAPPLDGVPARVPGSIALAESHAFIIESLGFGLTRPLPGELWSEATRQAWEERGFTAAAAAAVASAAPLVFVHVLRIDDAGHRHGGASAEYAAAAAWADAALVALHGAAPDARWLVLSDHGHTAAGGHGGSAPAIRLVRACLVEPGLAGAVTAGTPRLHLVDLARVLSDSLAVELPPGAAGRPLHAALAAPPSPGATLPRPGAVRVALAVAVGLLALVATLLAARFRVHLLPWWAVIGYASLVALEGVPSLSTRMIYSPLGKVMYEAALPGILVLAAVAGLTCRAAPLRLVVSQLALPLAALAGSLILCHGQPPLLPGVTAHASFLYVLSLSGCVVVGLALLASAVPRWFDRSRAAGSRRAGT